ncbi:MAG: MBL fold metallo-hydrolase [bacterium]
MNTYNNKLDSTDAVSPMDGWVLESCFLDLLVDEENPEDLDEWALQLGWTSVLANARARVGKIRPTDKDTCWPFAGSVPRSEIKEFDDPSRVVQWFLDMKAARVWASLDCDRTRYEYAQLPNGPGEQSVRKALWVVRNTLDAIILDSLAAFGSIPRNPEALKKEWYVLVALFHSEVCASGTTADVSYGMARAFDAFFLPELELPWRWLFQLVSTHNQGRGLSHQHNHVECIRLLEPLLESIDSKQEGDAKKYLPLTVRLVYFPAVFTLAEALKDCHRTTEAAWWLRRARNKRNKRQPRPYWKSRLDVELSLLESLEGRDPLKDKRIMPKLMNENQRRIYLKNERRISNKQKTKNLDDYTSKWAEALAWTIRWHEGDHVNLPGTIQGAAQSVKTVSESLKERFRNEQFMTYNRCLDKIIKVLDCLRQAIQSNPDPVFQFLSPEIDLADSRLKFREAINTWKALKLLMPALEAVIEFGGQPIEVSEPNPGVSELYSNLSKWLIILEDRLRKAWKEKRFADVASDQQVFELLQNPERLCPDPRRERRKNCRNYPNCAEKTMRLGDPGDEPDVASTDYLNCDNSPNCVEKTLQLRDIGKDNVASTKYLLSRISRTEAEFSRFLRGPSLELRFDRKEPVTPWTEFISLRRWNSFSPNLASRATTTVGGGYLIRVWNEKLGEYIGIAIDPGYNYLENLFDEGFTLSDLHVIVVTHAHPDHVENLSNILTLLRERKDRIRKTSRVFLVLTKGVFQRFKTLIDNEIDYIDDVVVLSWDRPKRSTVYVVRQLGTESNGRSVSLAMGDQSNPWVSIRAVRAIHADGTEFDSMGIVVRVVEQEGHDALQIGFTGDTRYCSELCTQGGFADCDVLIPHLGSVIKSEAFRNSHESWRLCDHKERLKSALKELQPTLTKKNHLFLPGISMLLCDLKRNSEELPLKETKQPLILLSEFGEELRGGLRADLAKRLQAVFEMTVLPADVGLRVGVKEQSVRCAICLQYVSAKHIKPVAVADQDEALVFVCYDCYRSRQHELPMLLSRLRNTPHEPHLTNESEVHKGSKSGADLPEADRQPPRQS